MSENNFMHVAITKLLKFHVIYTTGHNLNCREHIANTDLILEHCSCRSTLEVEIMSLVFEAMHYIINISSLA